MCGFFGCLWVWVWVFMFCFCCCGLLCWWLGRCFGCGWVFFYSGLCLFFCWVLGFCVSRIKINVIFYKMVFFNKNNNFQLANTLKIKRMRTSLCWQSVLLQILCLMYLGKNLKDKVASLAKFR